MPNARSFGRVSACSYSIGNPKCRACIWRFVRSRSRGISVFACFNTRLFIWTFTTCSLSCACMLATQLCAVDVAILGRHTKSHMQPNAAHIHVSAASQDEIASILHFQLTVVVVLQRWCSGIVCRRRGDQLIDR